ncbi:helix-turn-helix domain-containing protein [Nocardia sp. CA-107356]|uniref:helix-turn-helix domain-containing protein n=1 Tax=Nocardia sp. CA-107356 TaxID=3239972 RepID=UPI003D9257EA
MSYFVAVVEERNFTRGGARVDVVRSAVFAAIGRLEHEFGTLRWSAIPAISPPPRPEA